MRGDDDITLYTLLQGKLILLEDNKGIRVNDQRARWFEKCEFKKLFGSLILTYTRPYRGNIGPVYCLCQLLMIYRIIIGINDGFGKLFVYKLSVGFMGKNPYHSCSCLKAWQCRKIDTSTHCLAPGYDKNLSEGPFIGMVRSLKSLYRQEILPGHELKGRFILFKGFVSDSDIGQHDPAGIFGSRIHEQSPFVICKSHCHIGLYGGSHYFSGRCVYSGRYINGNYFGPVILEWVYSFYKSNRILLKFPVKAYSEDRINYKWVFIIHNRWPYGYPVALNTLKVLHGLGTHMYRRAG